MVDTVIYKMNTGISSEVLIPQIFFEYLLCTNTKR